MSSTLTVTNLTATNLTDGGGTTSTFANINQGHSKAWVNFNGSGTIAARDSHNVASLTDNSTGDYSVNYTNNFANDDYCGGGSSSYADGSPDANAGIVAPSRHLPNVAFTTSSSRLVTVLQTSTQSQFFDNAIVCWDVKGDLA